MKQPLKLLFVVVVAAFEVTLVHLGVVLIFVALTGRFGLNWPALYLTCLFGAWAALRFEAPADEKDAPLLRPTLIVYALTVTFLVKILGGGSWHPWRGWSVLWPFAGPQSLNLIALIGLFGLGSFVWWRGMLLIDYDHTDVLGVLQRGVLSIVAIALIVTLPSSVNLGAPPHGTLLAAEAVLLMLLGLLSLSLARVSDKAQEGARNRWRWLRSGIVTTLGLIGAGVLLIALVSDTGTLLVRAALLALSALGALLLSPFAGLLAALAERLPPLSTASPAPSGASLEAPFASPAADAGFGAALSQAILQAALVLLVLLPLLMIMLAIVLLRRRRHGHADDDGAQHESLWTWRALGQDLLGLLNNLRLPRRLHRLRDALATLRTDDPAQRIRRRYVELLLLGEQAERERPPHQTPLEFEPTLQPLAPTAAPELHTLTDTYDRARYAPATIEEQDAQRADAAWAAIQQHTKENR